MNRALLVGIGNYGRLGQPLPGCTNDLAGWRACVVPTLAINDANLRLRADAQATRDKLIDDLRWLLADASDGDQRIFFFAGHGARFRRRDPDTGEIDNTIDETLVTYPGASDDRETYMLFDSDLAGIVDQSEFPATARLTIVIDACHSGGMARPMFIDGVEPDDPLIRCMVFPEDEEEAAKARDLQLGPPEVRPFGSQLLEAIPRTFGVVAPVVSRVIVAAAAPEQKAWDDRMPNSKRHGIFSYYALEAIAAQSRISFDTLVATITPQIVARFPQQPMLLGDTGRFSGQIFN